MKKSLSFALLFTTLTVSLLSQTGCSLLGLDDEDDATQAAEEAEPPPELRRAERIELTFSRAALGGEEFEHYSLQGEILFYECGAGKFGRFHPLEQSLRPVPRKLTKPLRERIDEFLTALDEQPTWPKAEGGRGLSDAGTLTCQIREAGKQVDATIETSVDAVASRSTLAEKRLNRLIEVIRAVPPQFPCRNKVFFGLGRLGNTNP